jgi:hypothetical protein
MTTSEHFRSAVTKPSSAVPIAGVPWPAYKVMSLLLGLVVLVVVAVASGSAAPAVLGAAAAATVVWLGLSVFHRAG